MLNRNRPQPLTSAMLQAPQGSSVVPWLKVLEE